MSDTLHLHVTYKYYDQIKRGEKVEEYRIVEKWRGQIEGRDYKTLRIWKAYTSEFMDFPYRTPEIRTMMHEHFGAEPVTVYALRLENMK